MATYSLPDVCWLLTSLVAREMQTTSEPVTLGSSVPEWPVLSTRRMRLIQATTSCDDGLAGLSRLMTPLLTYSSIGRFRGEQPATIGVKWPLRTLSLS